MKRRKLKNKLVIIFFVILVVGYIITYSYVRHNFNRGEVIFYKSGDIVEYDGLEYRISAKLYDIDELVEEFGEEVRNLESGKSEKLYVVVKKEYERVKESDGNAKATTSFNVTFKYGIMGVGIDIEEYIQPKDYIREADLNVGESSWGYQVFSVAKINYATDVWNNIRNYKMYFEMPDYKGSEYLRKIEVN